MTTASSTNKINVAIRVRPFSRRDHELGTKGILTIENNQAVLQHPKGQKDPKVFAFDHCFASHGSPDNDFEKGTHDEGQGDIFDKIGLEIVRNAFLGYNACVFAYGQTGSGKSYTMMGSPDNKGIIPRLCEEVFRRIEESCSHESTAPDGNHPQGPAFHRDEPETLAPKYKVEVSYIEIYNERVHDLLDPSGGGKKNLKVREHSLLGPYVENLTILAVTSFADISMLLREGNKSRTVAATNMNTESSRSHAVFSIRMTQSTIDSNGGVTNEKVSKISLVDLAGSERVSKSGAAGERLKEGSNINKSLTTLGLVISTLADQSAGKVKTKFIPYRDSILTWLLKDNLGGNSLTTMVATLSPSSDNYEETLSTLRYADRAKRIVNHAVVNEDPRAKVIRELKHEVELLKAQLGLKMEPSSLKERLKQSEDLMQELEMPWEAKLAISEKIQQERQKALENIGISVDDTGIKMQNDQYYLVNLNSDPSFNEMLVYYLKQPKVNVGRPDTIPEQHIKLQGLGIMATHCTIDIVTTYDGDLDPNPQTPGVYITPIDGALTCVNGFPIHSKTILHHGDRILWGNYHFFRLNCPFQAGNETRANNDPRPPFQRVFPTDPTLKILDPYERATAELALNNGAGDGSIYPGSHEWLIDGVLDPFSPSYILSSTMANEPTTRRTRHDRSDSWDDSSSIGSVSLGTFRKVTARDVGGDNFLSSPPSPPSLGSMVGGFLARDKSRRTGAAVMHGPTRDGRRRRGEVSLGGGEVVEGSEDRRTREFRKSLVYLKEQIVHANLLAREANSIAAELSIPVLYSAVLQIPEDKLKVMNRTKAERGEILCESAILVKRIHFPHYVWSLGKFENKMYEMREMYHESKNDPLQEFNREDLFYDVNYTNVLLGVANVYLECLKYDIRFDYKVPIINQQGQIAGKLSVCITKARFPPTLAFPHDVGVGDKDRHLAYPMTVGRRSGFGMARNSLVNSSSSSSLVTSQASNFPTPQSTMMSESIVSTDSSGIYGSSSGSASIPSLQTIAAKIGIREALELQITRQDSVYLQYSTPHYNYQSYGSGGNKEFPEAANNARRRDVVSSNNHTTAPFLVVERKFKKKKKLTIGPQMAVSEDGFGPKKRTNGPCLYDKFGSGTGGSNGRNVKFKHENVISVEYPENRPEALNDYVLSVEVWCRRKLRQIPQANRDTLSTNYARGKVRDRSSERTLAGGDGSFANEQFLSVRRNTSLVRRWNEVKKRLELWVTISELNENGEYVRVEVTPESPCFEPCALNFSGKRDSAGAHSSVSPLANGTGGVFHVKQGRQRRISVELKTAGNGSLPLMCESIQAMHIGSILVSSLGDWSLSQGGVGNNYCDKAEADVLDSYQEQGLEQLRAKWTCAVDARRSYLDSHLQSFSQKSKKTKKDMIREQSLVDQWLTLTEERNALLLPSSGSEIPGSPADWEPPLGMEKHVPVVFLDTSLADLSTISSLMLPHNTGTVGDDRPDPNFSDYISDDSAAGFVAQANPDPSHAIGWQACLPGEPEEGQSPCTLLPYQSEAYVPLNIFRDCKTTTNTLVAVASWDSSVHESPHLNRCTVGSEKVFMVLKILVNLSHPVPIAVWLRKRLCLNVGSHKISLGEKIRRRMGIAEKIIDACGVTYDIVSNIPEDIKDLEARENLALLAANASSRSDEATNTAATASFERSSCSDNDEEHSYQFKGMYDALRRRIGGDDGYIQKYVESISALQSLLTFDKLRQEVVLREKLSTCNQLFHKTISVPDLNNISPSNPRTPTAAMTFNSKGRRRVTAAYRPQSLRSQPTNPNDSHVNTFARDNTRHEFAARLSFGITNDPFNTGTEPDRWFASRPKLRPGLGELVNTRNLTPLTGPRDTVVTKNRSSSSARGYLSCHSLSHSVSSHEINFCSATVTPTAEQQPGTDDIDIGEHDLPKISYDNGMALNSHLLPSLFHQDNKVKRPMNLDLSNDSLSMISPPVEAAEYSNNGPHQCPSSSVDICNGMVAPYVCGGCRDNAKFLRISPLSAPNPPLFWNMKPLKTVLEEINLASGNNPSHQTQ